jgi:hypothetical protein
MIAFMLVLQIAFALPTSYEVWMGDQGGTTGSVFRVFKEADVTASQPRNLFTEYDTNSMVPGVAAATGAAFSRLHGVTAGDSYFFSFFFFFSSASFFCLSLHLLSSCGF